MVTVKSLAARVRSVMIQVPFKALVRHPSGDEAGFALFPICGVDMAHGCDSGQWPNVYKYDFHDPTFSS